MNKFRNILMGAGILALATVLIGVGVANATLTLGTTSVTSDGNVTINGVTTSVYAVGAATTTGTITIGGAAQTGALTVGASTKTNTINIGSAITEAGLTQTINIGNGVAAATGVTAINIGNGATAGDTTVSILGANTTGTEVLNLGTGTGVKTIHIGDNATPANTITIGGAASTTTVGGTFVVTTPTRMEYRISSTSVDVGAVAVTPLYTVPAGKTAVITRVVIRSASASFNQATDPIFNIGWQAVASNVVASATYTTPASTTSYIQPAIIADATMGAAAEVLNFNVTGAATASTTATVDVFGYLF